MIEVPPSDTGTYRAWEPGDGLRCTLTHKAADGMPCGPPVVTRMVPFDAVGRRGTRRTEVMCANHVAGRFVRGGIGRLNAELDRKAREAVLAAHWDEYLAEREKRRADMVAEVAGAVPEEFRVLIERGLAAHDDDRGLSPDRP